MLSRTLAATLTLIVLFSPTLEFARAADSPGPTRESHLNSKPDTINKKQYRKLERLALRSCALLRQAGQLGCTSDELLNDLAQRFGGLARIPKNALAKSKILRYYLGQRTKPNSFQLRSQASASPSPSYSPSNPDVPCAANYYRCSQGQSEACCDPSNETCVAKEVSLFGIGGNYAGCAPKGQSNCATGQKFCSGKSGGAGVCCPNEAKCETAVGGMAVCDYPDSACPEARRCYTKTGAFSGATQCCKFNESCTPLGSSFPSNQVKVCSAQSCNGSGETSCGGKYGYTICCASGTTCSPSSDGNPNCVANSRKA